MGTYGIGAGSGGVVGATSAIGVGDEFVVSVRCGVRAQSTQDWTSATGLPAVSRNCNIPVFGWGE